MIPTSLIKTINREPCVMGEVVLSNGNLLVKVETTYLPFLMDTGHKNDLRIGDKVWVKCYKNMEVFSDDGDYEIYYQKGKATIYPVDTIHKYIFDCDEQQAREMTWEEKQEYLNPNYIDPKLSKGNLVEQEPEVSQEELWKEVLLKYMFPSQNSMKYLFDNWVLTRKNTTQ